MPDTLATSAGGVQRIEAIVGKNARTFGQDLMRGEHVVGGKVKRKPAFRPNGDLSEEQQRKLGGYIANGAVVSRGKANPINKENIPGYYLKREAGMTDEQILAEYGSGNQITGTSIFDPVLCELVYRWFSPPGGMVLDPFAGGSVRGIVASKCGRRYVGVELRPEQVAANREQAEAICEEMPPTWHAGDSLEMETLCGDMEADLVFSCPPYGDLEVYSDDPRDISTMEYPAFLEAYRRIIALSCNRLRDNRFACFVVGDIRDKGGNYRGLVRDTVAAFEDAGLSLYNDAVLVTAAGSLPIRVGKQFSASRKLGKTHQNVLVFVKGSGREAADACGHVDVADMQPDEVTA